MSEQPMDPRLEKLVAALYGELSEAEAREVEGLLATDARLRAEWDEMRAARVMLAKLDAEEPAPSFVFLTPAEAARPRGDGILGRVRAWFERMGPAPAWATAAAAVAVAVLALNGFHVERVDGGLAFRFGADAEIRPAAETAGPAAADPLGEIAGMPETGPAGDGTTTVPYLTANDMTDYETRFYRGVTALLNDYGEYRREEQAAFMQVMYQDLLKRQDDMYRDLRDRVEAVGLGLLMERSQSDLLRQSGRGSDSDSGLPPGATLPAGDSKENEQ